MLCVAKLFVYSGADETTKQDTSGNNKASPILLLYECRLVLRNFFAVQGVYTHDPFIFSSKYINW